MMPSINWGLIANAGHIVRVAKVSWLARLGRWLKDHT